MHHDLRFARVVLDSPFLFAFDYCVDSLDNAFCGGEGVQLRIVVDVDVFVEEDYWVQFVPWVLFQ